MNFPNAGALSSYTRAKFKLSLTQVISIISFPIIIVLVFIFFIVLPGTRSYAFKMLNENQPVELLTFAFLIIGGVSGLILVKQLAVNGLHKFELFFYTTFSLAFLFIALEEIAWGQWFFGFATPEVWKDINAQGETTFHNIRGIQGHTEILRLAFGLGGLIGIKLGRQSFFSKIGAPALLGSYFLVILILAAIDLYNDFFPFEGIMDKAVQKLSELVELLIAISGVLYIWLNRRMLFPEPKNEPEVK